MWSRKKGKRRDSGGTMQICVPRVTHNNDTFIILVRARFRRYVTGKYGKYPWNVSELKPVVARFYDFLSHAYDPLTTAVVLCAASQYVDPSMYISIFHCDQTDQRNESLSIQMNRAFHPTISLFLFHLEQRNCYCRLTSRSP